MNDQMNPVFQKCLNSFFGFPESIGTECVGCGVAIPKPANSTEEGGPLCAACAEKDEETGEKLRELYPPVASPEVIGQADHYKILLPMVDIFEEEPSEPLRRGSGDPSGGYIERADHERERGEREKMFVGDPVEDSASEDFSEPKERGSLYPCADADRFRL